MIPTFLLKIDRGLMVERKLLQSRATDNHLGKIATEGLTFSNDQPHGLHY